MKKKIVVTGGGTGGHVFPAIAICEEMRSRNFTPIYVGSATGMEAKLVPPTGIEFHTVRSKGVKNKGIVASLRAIFTVALSVVWSIRFLLKEKPVAVIGVGGYVSVPISVAAFLLRIPLFLQEQNSSVGIANRFLGRLARKIFLGFGEAASYFPRRKCVVTGNPLRREFRTSAMPDAEFDEMTLLVFGGSQGAKAVNDAVLATIPSLKQKFPGLKVIHQTGEKDFDSVKTAYQSLLAGAEVSPFIHKMLEAYLRASFVVCRSGALTVSELIQVGRPALLVPFPRRGQNDQTTNAYLLQKHQVGVVVEQGENFTDRFKSTLLETIDPSRLRRMAGNFSALRGGDALVSIGDHVTEAVSSFRG